MNNNVNSPILDSGWIYRLHSLGIDQSTRLCVLLHGWTGDEFSMDVFLRAIPPVYRVLSPRGPYPALDKGYSWISYTPGIQPPFSEFQATSSKLLSLLNRLSALHNLPNTKITVIGFSQGAAMALAFALTFPDRVERAACLSGYLPQSGLPSPEETDLSGLAIFIAHGMRDKIVPVENAIKAATWLESAGAQVSICQADVGHRLHSKCFSKLKEFLS